MPVVAIGYAGRDETSVRKKNSIGFVTALQRKGRDMSDIIERIKGLRYVHVPQASQLFEEAIAEIERLRLTDAEREAIQAATRIIDAYDEEMDGFPSGAAATLRSLLARLG